MLGQNEIFKNEIYAKLDKKKKQKQKLIKKIKKINKMMKMKKINLEILMDKKKKNMKHSQKYREDFLIIHNLI